MEQRNMHAHACDICAHLSQAPSRQLVSLWFIVYRYLLYKVLLLLNNKLCLLRSSVLQFRYRYQRLSLCASYP